MKEKILETLRELGFKYEESDEAGYLFHYEGINLLLFYDGKDEDFLNISVPCIYDFEDGNALACCALSEKINSTLKYVKAYMLGGSMWLFYERELSGNDDLPQLITRMVLHLDAAFRFVQDAKKEIEEKLSRQDESETNDNNEE